MTSDRYGQKKNNFRMMKSLVTLTESCILSFPQKEWYDLIACGAVETQSCGLDCDNCTAVELLSKIQSTTLNATNLHLKCFWVASICTETRIFSSFLKTDEYLLNTLRFTFFYISMWVNLDCNDFYSALFFSFNSMHTCWFRLFFLSKF